MENAYSAIYFEPNTHGFNARLGDNLIYKMGNIDNEFFNSLNVASAYLFITFIN